MAEPYIQVLGLDRLKRNLSFAQQDAFPAAAASAINRSARTTLSRNLKSVAKAMGLRQKDVRDNTRLIKARSDPHKLFARIEFRGDALNLVRFKAKQRKKGVSAAPWGNRRIFRGAFVASIHGTDVVMIRKKGVGTIGEGETPESRRAAAAAAASGGGRRQSRLPIRAMKGPGIAKTAHETEHGEEREEVFSERMAIEFPRRLDFYVARFS